MKIEYNFISRGTERATNKGYMALSQIQNNYRYIMPLDHCVTSVETLTKDYLRVHKKFDIFDIVLARFQLISRLSLDYYKFNKNSKILVVGCGCVGFALLCNLYVLNYKNVVYATRKHKYFKNFKWINIKNINFEDYEIIFDTTGDSSVLENIVNKMSYHATLVLVGTPRDNPKIDFVYIHRKNLKVLGAHELFGFSPTLRQKTFDKILRQNIKNKFNLNEVCCFIKDKDCLDDTKIYNIIKR